MVGPSELVYVWFVFVEDWVCEILKFDVFV